jgi:hypothetical protein
LARPDIHRRSCPLAALRDPVQGLGGLFQYRSISWFHRELQKIDRSVPIVTETGQAADRRNSRLKSRAQIFDGPVRAENSTRYHGLEPSSGSDPEPPATIATSL